MTEKSAYKIRQEMIESIKSDRTRLRCKLCGCLPVVMTTLSDTAEDGPFRTVEVDVMPDDQYLNGHDIDGKYCYIVRCECSYERYDNPAAAVEAWNHSGATVTDAWQKEFLRLVNGMSTAENRDLRDALIKHVFKHVSANEPQLGGSPGWPQDEPEFGPIGYISESAKHMLQQGTKAFIRPQRDSLAKLPVYVGKPDVS